MKMKKIISAIVLLTAAWTQAMALQVNNNAGSLAQQVTDLTVSDLTITGSMDARDFYFIATQLPALRTLDLSAVNVVAYSAPSPLIAGNTEFRANELPQFALFDLPLTRVELPASLKTIGRAALSKTQLSAITFPAQLDSIADYALSACPRLTEVSVPATVRAMGKGVFSRCDKLTSVALSPAQAMVVPEDAFLDCAALNAVSLGTNVTVIGAHAFAGCTALKNVNVATSSTLAAVEEGAFAGSGLTTIDFLRNGQVSRLGQWAFANAALVAANVPASVTTLGDGAFFYNTSLTGVTLPSLDEVPHYLLAGSGKVSTGEVIPESTKRIGDYAFYNWDATTFVIPSGVNYIGTRAMAGMTSLTQLETRAATVPALGENVWEGVNQASVRLLVPDGTAANYKAAEQWKQFNIDGSGVRGDVNGDGYVNGTDVTALYEYLLNRKEVKGNPDVNEDGNVNGTDVTSLYNILLGNTSAYAPARINSRLSNDVLKARPVTLDAAGEAVLTLELDNAMPYTTFQLDFTLPHGLTVTGMTTGARAHAMHMGYSELSDGAYRVLGFSPTLAVLDGHNGTLINIALKASDDYTGGEVEMQQILMVETDETSNWLATFSIPVEGVTAVQTIDAATAAGPVNVYNMQGQLMRRNVEAATATQGLPAGTYIVGNKKVLVK